MRRPIARASFALRTFWLTAGSTFPVVVLLGLSGCVGEVVSLGTDMSLDDADQEPSPDLILDAWPNGDESRHDGGRRDADPETSDGPPWSPPDSGDP